ncbi:MAG: FmdB family zinc ribbon protein [Desulforhopalus sp.]
MPIYEYKCDNCGTIFEVLTLSASDNGPVICTSCNSDKVAKVLSTISLKLSSAKNTAAAPTGCSKSGFS